MCAICRIHNGHKVVFYFRHATPCHYHHGGWLLACVEHNKCLLGTSCQECVLDGISSFDYLFCNIWGCMCWPGPFEFRWLKGYIHIPFYYHHQIGSIHLSHCCHIFPWLCVWDGCTTIFCHTLHIYLRNTGTLFQLLMFSLLMFSLWYLQTIGYIMACRSYSCVCRLRHLFYHHYHHYEDSSEGIELIKCLSGICCRVCV